MRLALQQLPWPHLLLLSLLLMYPDTAILSILEQASHAPIIHISALGLSSALKVPSKMLHDLFSHLLKVLPSK